MECKFFNWIFLQSEVFVISDGPSIQLAKSEDSGTEMKITCIVDSNPPSKIRWLKDGVPLEAELLSNAVSNHEKKQVLRLVDLDYDSFGNYSCLAENKLGKDEAMTKISGTCIAVFK